MFYLALILVALSGCTFTDYGPLEKDQDGYTYRRSMIIVDGPTHRCEGSCLERYNQSHK